MSLIVSDIEGGQKKIVSQNKKCYPQSQCMNKSKSPPKHKKSFSKEIPFGVRLPMYAFMGGCGTMLLAILFRYLSAPKFLQIPVFLIGFFSFTIVSPAASLYSAYQFKTLWIPRVGYTDKETYPVFFVISILFSILLLGFGLWIFWSISLGNYFSIFQEVNQKVIQFSF